jgi:hypothetical protein
MLILKNETKPACIWFLVFKKESPGVAGARFDFFC